MGLNKKYSNGYWKVYVHVNKTNGKKYVGITSQKPEYRWNYGKSYQSNPYFTAAINQHGWDGFEHIVLHDCLSESEAKSKERELIALWQTQNRRYGYNITAGGESTSGFVPSPELRKRWSEIRTGQKRSEETKRKLAEAGRRTFEKSRRALAEAKYVPVKMFDANGVFIKQFGSIQEAEKEIGTSCKHVSDVCKGRRKFCAGYIWQYA